MWKESSKTSQKTALNESHEEKEIGKKKPGEEFYILMKVIFI